ncbi:nucleotidyltransferase [Evansella cellulosilytica]|uniref:tRNA(Met) cytidine acetate ligase n=1 Tax=Evansella cellulosilytica (strain ATCC 21833 / DSM 2522 / FERM P-1141 / JCM 9156 / N-4) TaxID=649639 RepID=E6TTU8_EVAC2|nr:nucleotidyltransferase [Evansella cellulosilytica]ADU30867.1 protein of unknown function DUF795 [Evansella cellulosilytica DSM 2522]
MNVLGVIVEYNPFHYGHLYHLDAAKKKTNADVTVAVMSGSFLQRGEPAITSKWTRTKMALKGGVDLVIELPYIYSTQKAEIFSDAAVSLLDELKVNQLCFGSESGNIDHFIHTVDVVSSRNNEIDERVRDVVKTGVSYPRAFSIAYREVFDNTNESILDLGKPNNILGYHYVKSIKKRGSKMTPCTITREQANYHDTEVTKHQKIASATAIRKLLIENNFSIEAVEQYVPPSTLTLLRDEIHTGTHFLHWEHYFPFIRYKLLTTPTSELRAMYECEEGIEHRLIKMMKDVNSFQSFMEAVKTKRYTWTRIQRLILHILTNTSKGFMEQHCHPLSPQYIRLLGMTNKGRNYLSSIKKDLRVPLVSRASEFQHEVLQKDIQVSQLHTLPYEDETLQQEFKSVPIQYD